MEEAIREISKHIAGRHWKHTINLPELGDNVAMDTVLFHHNPHHLFQTGELSQRGFICTPKLD
jgi:hypothetical protein